MHSIVKLWEMEGGDITKSFVDDPLRTDFSLYANKRRGGGGGYGRRCAPPPPPRRKKKHFEPENRFLMHFLCRDSTLFYFIEPVNGEDGGGGGG